MGTYVIGMLEQVYGKGAFHECGTVEFKAACIATTFALESQSYWLAAEDENRVGVVIASDVAKYPLASPGEYTQGAGSVSLLLKKNPRLLALEQIYGHFTRDENDFFRPMGCTTAVVNGKHSNQCYLDAMKGAFDSYAAKAARKGVIVPENGQCVTDYLDHILFHIPYPRMVEYASAAVFRHDWSKCARSRKVEEEIGPEPGGRGLARTAAASPGGRGELRQGLCPLAPVFRGFCRQGQGYGHPLPPDRKHLHWIDLPWPGQPSGAGSAPARAAARLWSLRQRLLRPLLLRAGRAAGGVPSQAGIDGEVGREKGDLACGLRDAA